MSGLIIEDIRGLETESGVGIKSQGTSRDLNPVEVKADAAALAAIGEIEQPHLSDRIDPKIVTETPPVGEKVAEAAAPVLPRSEANLLPKNQNPGLEGVKAALLYERNAIVQLNKTEEETSKHLKAIDDLLDLSSALSALSDKDRHDVTDTMQTILNQLKENGIDLLKGDPEQMTKEQLIEVKSIIGSHVDKSRTKVQQIFTKMQNIIQNMMSVNDSGKRFVSEFTQLLRTISKNMRAG